MLLALLTKEEQRDPVAAVKAKVAEYNEKCKEDWERVPRYDFEDMKLVRSGWEEGQQLKKVPGYKLENFGEYGDLLVPGVWGKIEKGYSVDFHYEDPVLCEVFFSVKKLVRFFVEELNCGDVEDQRYWKDEQRKEKKRADRLAKSKALREKRERERVLGRERRERERELNRKPTAEEEAEADLEHTKKTNASLF